MNQPHQTSLRKLGTVRRTHGKSGHVIVAGVAPNFLGLPAGSRIAIGFSEQFAKPYSVRECEPHGASRDFAFLLDGIATPEAAAALKEMAVFADDALVRENSSGEFLEDDIVGCTVFNVDTRERLGTMREVWYMPASEVWVMDIGKGEVPIPAVPTFIKRVDVATKEIDVFVMDGLLELAENARSSGDENDDDDGNGDDEGTYNKNVEAA
jgi:16S rRNA processing protein RimM